MTYPNVVVGDIICGVVESDNYQQLRFSNWFNCPLAFYSLWKAVMFGIHHLNFGELKTRETAMLLPPNYHEKQWIHNFHCIGNPDISVYRYAFYSNQHCINTIYRILLMITDVSEISTLKTVQWKSNTSSALEALVDHFKKNSLLDLHNNNAEWLQSRLKACMMDPDDNTAQTYFPLMLLKNLLLVERYHNCDLNLPLLQQRTAEEYTEFLQSYE